jgi:thiol-disulfide isomerase/thioredoxin
MKVVISNRREFALALIAVVVVTACGAPGAARENMADGEQTVLPSRPLAPSTTFDTVEGGTASIADLRGSVLIVNFWGTWCVPCRREIPELVELHEAYADRDVEIIGIAVDSGEADEIRTFADRYGVQYRLWMTDMATALEDFQSVGYPFTLVIDREGGVVNTYYGPQTLEALSAEIDALLE